MNNAERINSIKWNKMPSVWTPELLREFRETLGATQEQFSLILGKQKSGSQISRMETGKDPIKSSIRQVLTLAYRLYLHGADLKKDHVVYVNEPKKNTVKKPKFAPERFIDNPIESHRPKTQIAPPPTHRPKTQIAPPPTHKPNTQIALSVMKQRATKRVEHLSPYKQVGEFIKTYLFPNSEELNTPEDVRAMMELYNGTNIELNNMRMGHLMSKAGFKSKYITLSDGRQCKAYYCTYMELPETRRVKDNTVIPKYRDAKFPNSVDEIPSETFVRGNPDFSDIFGEKEDMFQ